MSQNTNCHSSIHLSLDVNQVPSDNILSARPSASLASSSLGFHLSVRGSAARALVTGVKLAMEEPPGRVGPLPEMKTMRFSPTLV